MSPPSPPTTAQDRPVTIENERIANGCRWRGDGFAEETRVSRNALRNAPQSVQHRLLQTPTATEHRNTLQRVPLVVNSASEDQLARFSLSSETSQQLVVSVARPISDDIVIEFRHETACGEVLEAVRDGGAFSLVSPDGNRQFSVAEPWAFDSDGHSLSTQFFVADGSLFQSVDVRGATPPIYIDPEYEWTWCNDERSFASAAHFLDLDTNGSVTCPIVPAFWERAGYLPKLGRSPNVFDDYGLVMGKPDGDCGNLDFTDIDPGEDIGHAWDFDQACDAHDYCYDLIRAGMLGKGNSSKDDCDDAFNDLMKADCNNRPNGGWLPEGTEFFWCENKRGTFDLAVSAIPGPGTSPPFLSLRAGHSSKCADVEGSNLNSGARVLQWPCTGNANQRFQFNPTDDGIFEIKPQHSIAVNSGERCITRISNGTLPLLWQYVCYSTSLQRYRLEVIKGGLTSWTIGSWRYYRIKDSQDRCWDVPYSYTANSVQISTYSCTSNPNQSWRLLG